LALCFQTSVIALATLGHLQFKNGVSTKMEKSFEKKGEKKMAVGFKESKRFDCFFFFFLS